VTFLQRLQSERKGEDPAAEKRHIREQYVERTDAELARFLGENPTERDFFLRLGSDQVILSFSFNFIDKNGALNRDLAKANMLNDRIFAICSLTSDEEELLSKRLFLTSSKFTTDDYGPAFTNEYCRRLGVDPIDGVGVNFLITTTMDPWTTQLEPAEGAKLVGAQAPPMRDFLVEIEAAIRSAGEQALEDLNY
jgi:hypothetical protein